MGASGAWIEWSNSMITISLAAGIGLMLVVGFGILFVRMRKIRKESRDTLAQRYNPGDIVCHDNFAHYFGMEPLKGKQVRGKGVLVLTEKELYFLKLLPRMELSIPVKRIKRCTTPTNYLGKTIHKPLLKIEFNDEEGKLLSVAWHIRNLSSFENALKLQRKKYRPKKRK